MSVKTKNEELQRQMRRRTAERRSGRPVRLPPDKDKLARWQGDHAALLARLQESYEELRQVGEVISLEGEPVTVSPENYSFIGELISEAVEHFGRMPR